MLAIDAPYHAAHLGNSVGKDLTFKAFCPEGLLLTEPSLDKPFQGPGMVSLPQTTQLSGLTKAHSRFRYKVLAPVGIQLFQHLSFVVCQAGNSLFLH